MDRLHLINVFVAVVDANGFAGAARKLNMSPPAVTRAVNELEAHLGVRLLTRTTRALRVTEPGERYVSDCRQILAQLAEADEAASDAQWAPRGRLTITAPVQFGAMHVMPIVTEYLNLYSEMSVACWFVDRVVSLLDEGADIGIRIGDLPDSSMRAVRVGQLSLVVCATPAYFEAHGTPEEPEDLPGHSTIGTSGVAAPSEWRFLRDGEVVAIRLQSRLATSGDTAVAAALNGFGLANVLSYKVAQHISAGRLRSVLAEFAPPPVPVHIVHREGQNASRKTRAFIDLATERLRAGLAQLW